MTTQEDVDFIGIGLARVELLDGNRLLPSIIFDEEVIKVYSTPWQDALIVTLLGMRLSYLPMKIKLKLLWKLNGNFDMMDIDNGFFMVKFDQELDRNNVLEGGPWMIFDHYLALAKWTPNFDSTTASVSRTLVWIRFSGLNHLFYEENFLFPIASAVGRPVKMDVITEMVGRGKFARVCVEIDLAKPVVGKVCVQGHWHKVEYEGLHLICKNCGCYGHVTPNCTSSSPLHSGDASSPMSEICREDGQIGIQNCIKKQESSTFKGGQENDNKELDNHLVQKGKNSEIFPNLTSKVEEVLSNQSFLKTQLELLAARVEKTLGKADKFPSKKDFQSFTQELTKVVQTTSQIEQTTIVKLLSQQKQLLEKQSEADTVNLQTILSAIKEVRNTFLGYDPDIGNGII